MTGFTSLRDKGVHRVRSAIVSGRSAPGTMYSVPALADELGISTTPVREALRDLSRSGLLDAKPAIARYQWHDTAQRAHLLRQISGGEHGHYARRCFRPRCIDASDPSMGMRRAQDEAVRLVADADVVHIATGAAQEGAFPARRRRYAGA